MIIGGGMGEEYMGAPKLSVGDGKKGGGSFIAGLLDLLGIHKQVAKGPKEGEKGAESQAPIPVDTPNPPAAAPTAPKAQLSILDDAESAFAPLTPMGSKFGRGGLTILPSTLR